MPRSLKDRLSATLSRAGLRRAPLAVRPATGAQPQIARLLLCLGAQKSGTTWLHQVLTQHPGIFAGPYKEPQYFTHVHCHSQLAAIRKARRLQRLLRTERQAFLDYQCGLDGGADPQGFAELLAPIDDDWYLSLFAGAGDAWAADFSPDYAALGPEGLRHIKRLSTDQRVLFVMREPMARMQSAIRYHLRHRDGGAEQASDAEILEVARIPAIWRYNQYAATASLLRGHFPENHLRFLIYEDMAARPRETVDAIFDWLGLPPFEVPGDILGTRRNVTRPHLFSEKVTAELERVAGPERDKALRLFPAAEAYWR